MKQLIVLAFIGGCLLPLNSPAMDLKQAKFTQVVNKVAVFSAANHVSRPVAANDIFKMPDALRTGPDSRAELIAADKTITRVGANTIFSYDNENRTIDLQQGSLLFHSEPGKGGGIIHTPAAIAAVVGTTIIVTCTPDGGFKVLDLEGEVAITFKNGDRQYLQPGQMTFVLPGGNQRAPIIIFRLDSETKDSLLVSGFAAPLPSMPKINAEVTRQLLQILNNQVDDTGLIVGNKAGPGTVQVYADLATVNIQTHHQQLVVDTQVSAAGDISVGSGATTFALTLTAGSSVSSSSGSVDLAAAGTIAASGTGLNAGVNTTVSAGDTLSIDASVVTAISQVALSGVNGVSISGAVITATDPATGSVAVSSGGSITVGGTTTITAPAITLNAGDGILLDGTGGSFSGNSLSLTAANTATVQNADLTAFPTVNMAAHTLNLINVAFGGGSVVNLHSFLGILAPLPNTGLLSVPGAVNFISGVTYGGTTISALNEGRYVTGGTGAGIHISTLP
jgi:ferric-dicitrate binding protein FerR (iron transport regulator)